MDVASLRNAGYARRSALMRARACGPARGRRAQILAASRARSPTAFGAASPQDCCPAQRPGPSACIVQVSVDDCESALTLPVIA